MSLLFFHPGNHYIDDPLRKETKCPDCKETILNSHERKWVDGINYKTYLPRNCAATEVQIISEYNDP